jgi:hypothetical protein
VHLSGAWSLPPLIHTFTTVVNIKTDFFLFFSTFHNQLLQLDNGIVVIPSACVLLQSPIPSNCALLLSLHEDYIVVFLC